MRQTAASGKSPGVKIVFNEIKIFKILMKFRPNTYEILQIHDNE